MNTVIVIPFYSPEMKPEERASLVQASRVFADKRDIVFAVPRTLDCRAYLDIIPRAQVQRFDDAFFTSVSSYSSLLLTQGFYRRFETYDFMLIYQLDGWVFRDSLDDWCRRGYEYVGAPFWMKDGKKDIPVVGNGGVSLRNIAAMLRVLSFPEKRMFPPGLLLRFCRNSAAAGHYIRALVPLLRLAGILPNSRGRYLEKVRRKILDQEDVVFYFLSQAFTPDGLRMPDLEEAALFALDATPRTFFRELPVFCHAWMKNDPEFWKKYIGEMSV
ncbi:MAG: hypothetical protein IKC65_08700 [Lentisphaeria bacterium]|nr:hypothetical protein [Lentisphaeria bacterium]